MRNHVERRADGLAGAELETATDIFRDLVTPSGAKVAHTAIDLAQMTAHSRGHGRRGARQALRGADLRAVDPAPGTATLAMRSTTTGWRRRSSTGATSRRMRGWSAPGSAPSSRPRPSDTRLAASSAEPGSCSGSVVGLLLLLVAVAVLLKYANDASNTRRPRSAARRRTSGWPAALRPNSPTGRTYRCCWNSPRTPRTPAAGRAEPGGDAAGIEALGSDRAPARTHRCGRGHRVQSGRRHAGVGQRRQDAEAVERQRGQGTVRLAARCARAARCTAQPGIQPDIRSRPAASTT